MYDAAILRAASLRALAALSLGALAMQPLCATATDDPDIPPLRDLPDFDSEWTDENVADLPMPEKNPQTVKCIKRGIALQRQLLQIMLSIKDKTTADTAAKAITALTTELRRWGMEMEHLPQEDAMIIDEYRRDHLGEIKLLSDTIRKEGERLATYGYFGSDDLKNELKEMVKNTR